MRWRRGGGHTYLYLTGFLGSRQQGREKYKGKSKGEREKKKEREKGHQWGDMATGRAATAPLPPRLGGSGGWQEVAGGSLPPRERLRSERSFKRGE